MAVNDSMRMSPLQGQDQALSSTGPVVAIRVEFSRLHGDAMAYPMTVPCWEAYADARSCLGALADLAVGNDPGRFESLLIQLDGIHGGAFPATCPGPWTAAELLTRLEDAVDRMIEQGGDGLSLELLLAEAGVW